MSIYPTESILEALVFSATGITPIVSFGHLPKGHYEIMQETKLNNTVTADEYLQSLEGLIKIADFEVLYSKWWQGNDKYGFLLGINTL